MPIWRWSLVLRMCVSEHSWPNRYSRVSEALVRSVVVNWSVCRSSMLKA